MYLILNKFKKMRHFDIEFEANELRFMSQESNMLKKQVQNSADLGSKVGVIAFAT